MSALLLLGLLAGHAEPPNWLDRVTLHTCGDARWAAQSVWVTQTVLPDGHVVFGVLPVDPEWNEASSGPLIDCVRKQLAAFGGVTALPSKSVTVMRRFELPETANASQLRDALDAGTTAFEACFKDKAARGDRDLTARLRIELHPDGGTRVTPLVLPFPRSEGRIPQPGMVPAKASAAAAQCVVPLLPQVAEPQALRITLRAQRATLATTRAGKTDGREGATCFFGERETNELTADEYWPELSPCRSGLQCCYSGGVAGLGSSCMRVGRDGCPRYP